MDSNNQQDQSDSYQSSFAQKDSDVINSGVDSLQQSKATPESEQLFRAIFEQAAAGIGLVKITGQWLQINQKLCDILGYTREELIEKTYQEITHPEEAEADTECIQQLLGGKQTLSREKRFICKDGTIIWTNLTVSLVRDALGEPNYIIGVIEDITKRKQLEAALQASVEQERLVAAIAQRIRSSLNLEEILYNTVVEVRQFLQTDRVIICRFQPDSQAGTIVVESLDSGLPSMLNYDLEINANAYNQSSILAIEDIYTAAWNQNYIDLLSRFQVKAKIAVPIQQKEQLWGLLIAYQCSGIRQWQQLEIDVLQQLVTQVAIAIEQAQIYKQKQYQVQREQALNRVTQAIRASLDLKTIFATAVDEIGKVLQVDRVEIVQYLPERKLWLNIAEYRQHSNLPIDLGTEIPDEGNEIATRLKQLEIVQINDTATLTDEFNRNHAQNFPGAWLLVPLHFQSFVWGSLTLIIDNHPYYWQDLEVELACTIANQLAIAIQQSELYQQVQQLNTNLERQVQKRTAQLQQVLDLEAMLKRITDKVRDSLDESQILQTAVQELALGLEVKCCDAALYNAEQTTSTIQYEYACSMPSSLRRVLQIADFPEIYPQLLQGQFFQYCPLIPDAIRGDVSIFTCPIFDNQGVLGDLWLFKQKEETFNDLEVRLVKQIANQCAIAMRQAHLYQAVQVQVEELAKFNRLKDDFLSTVSHELRTPLTNMKMAIQMLTVAFGRDGTLVQQDKTYKYLQILQDECAREISLINNLLDLQRLESKEQTSNPEIIHLQTWLPQLIEPFQQRFHNSSQTLQLNISSTLPPLFCDPYILSSVLRELLNNACKYTPAGEQIIVKAETKPELIQIQVINSGAEIPTSEIPRIFDKFYRVPNTDPWKQSGIGLGLALAQKTIEHLGGTIQVTSQLNQICFTVELPLKAISD